MKLKLTVLFLLVTASQLRGQDSIVIFSPNDSIILNTITENQIKKTEIFYDSLKTKSLRKSFTKFFYNSLFTDPKKGPIDSTAGYISVESIKSLRKEGRDFQEYKGKTIASINVLTLDVYDKELAKDFLRKATNSLHMVTRKWVIKDNLMFKIGDKFMPTIIINNEVYLRNLPYISQANIIVIPSETTPDEVDIVVITRDKWTISGNANLSKTRLMGQIYDNNFLGTGSRLAIRTYLWKQKPVYAGNQFQFDTPNLFGSFIKFRTTVGKGFEEYIAKFSFDKEFINPGDYALCTSYGFQEYNYGFVTKDTSQIVSNTTLNLWLGKSFRIGHDGGAIYTSGRYEHYGNHKRPEVSENLNSRFHDHKLALLSLGFYKENFYRGRFIYGFGREEDIPFGYRFDVTGGHYNGEFDNMLYVGATASGGGRTEIGYMRGSLSWGSLVREGDISRTTLLVNLSGFSNLISAGKNYYVRQFMDIDLTMGFHRLEGEGERVVINGYHRPRGMLYQHEVYGRDRILMRNETVVFTPLFLYGFRCSFFGYWDLAFIGDKPALFTNNFYSTIGCGIRLRNERFIFKNIELRLSIAIKTGGMARGEWIGVGEEPRLTPQTYRPGSPQFLPYN